jgi:hypothetical protein
MQSDITVEIKNQIDTKELFRRHYPHHFKAYGNSLCPFHKDTDGSLSFRNGGFKCFSVHCDAHGDVIDLYMKIHGCDFREAIKGLQGETGITSKELQKRLVTEESPLPPQAEEKPRPDFAKRYEQLLRAGLIPVEAIEYLTQQRCLSEKLVEKLEQDEMMTWLDDGYTQMIVFPVFDTANLGEMVGYQKIPIFGGEKWFAKNANGRVAVFSYGQPGPVIVTESILDGLSAIDCLSCSMLSIMSSGGTSKLAHHKGKDLVLFLDNDDAGRSATKKAVKVLGRQCRVVNWSLAPDGFKDVNDLLKAGHGDIIEKMILEAQPPAGLDPDILDENYIEGFKFPERVELVDHSFYTGLSAGMNTLRTHIATPGNKLARTPAGLGKTTLAADLAYSQAKDQIVHYYLPNHMICREVAEKLHAINPNDDVPITHLMGRASDGRNGSQIVCTVFIKASAVIKRGYDPGAVLCPKCDSRKKCRHALQLARIKEEKRGLIIAPHSYIPIHLAPQDDNDAPGKLAYVDENPLDVMLHPSEPCGIEDLNILRPYVTSDCIRLFDMLQQLIHTVYVDLVSKKKKLARYYTVTSPVAQWKDRLSLWDALGITKEEAVKLCGHAMTHLETMPVTHLYERGVPLIATNWLKAALSEAVAYLEIRDNGKAVFVNMVKEKVDPKSTIVLLDATIDYNEARMLFDREFAMVDINVPWEGRRIHIQTGMGIVKTKDIAKNKDTQQLAKALETAACYLDDSQNLYLATYKHHEHQCGRIMRQILPSTTVLTGHYGAIRSSNRYEACDSAILFGALRVPPEARLDAAAMLFPNDPGRQERWMLHKDYEEVYQNAHRLRLIRNPGRTLIIVDRDWPAYLLGEPDFVIPIRSTKTKIGRAVERALEFISKHLELSKKDCWKIGVGSKEDEIRIRRQYDAHHGHGGELILFSDANWWTALSRAIQERNPDIEVTSLRSKHGKPCKVLHILRNS